MICQLGNTTVGTYRDKVSTLVCLQILFAKSFVIFWEVSDQGGSRYFEIQKRNSCATTAIIAPCKYINKDVTTNQLTNRDVTTNQNWLFIFPRACRWWRDCNWYANHFGEQTGFLVNERKTETQPPCTEKNIMTCQLVEFHNISQIIEQGGGRVMLECSYDGPVCVNCIAHIQSSLVVRFMRFVS